MKNFVLDISMFLLKVLHHYWNWEISVNVANYVSNMFSTYLLGSLDANSQHKQTGISWQRQYVTLNDNCPFH